MFEHWKNTFLSIIVGCSFLWIGVPEIALCNPTSGVPGLAENLTEQLAVFSRMKASRSAAQKKINSQIIFALQKQKGTSVFSQFTTFKPAISVPPNGILLVDIKAKVTQSVLDAIGDVGGEVVNHHSNFDAIRARIPITQIERLAENNAIWNIRPADKAILNKINVSEGDIAHGANLARTSNGFDGTGIKVGVLSDSVDHLETVQASGDLPTVTVISDAPGNSGEGTAMLEIVHDLAPGSGLYFATAWNGMADFATQIIALADAGCDIIVDDVAYFVESPFQDDVISQAVNTVNDRGVLYFSSAGNFGNLNDGESGVWEGDYNPIATTVPNYASVHSFDGADPLNSITSDAGAVTLHWSDPLGGSGNDYDLFLVDPVMNVIVYASDDFQDGDDDPIEGLFFSTGIPAEFNLMVALYYGEQRFINLSTHSGRLKYGTDGQMRGHACAVNAFGVGAVDATMRKTPFNGSESVEKFSSDGPRRVFFQPDGTPITPGNFLSTGGSVRNKPDIAAADGVATATPGFDPFYGTSAAAPHAAAIGALILDANGSLSISDLRQIFMATALDIEGAGWDRDSGAGIFMADSAANYVCSTFGCKANRGLPPGILTILLEQ